MLENLCFSMASMFGSKKEEELFDVTVEAFD